MCIREYVAKKPTLSDERLLFRCVMERESTLDNQIKALRDITNEDIHIFVALTVKIPRLQIISVLKIRDEKTLLDLATNAEDERVKEYAFNRMKGLGYIAKIAS